MQVSNVVRMDRRPGAVDVDVDFDLDFGCNTKRERHRLYVARETPYEMLRSHGHHVYTSITLHCIIPMR